MAFNLYKAWHGDFCIVSGIIIYRSQHHSLQIVDCITLL